MGGDTEISAWHSARLLSCFRTRRAKSVRLGLEVSQPQDTADDGVILTYDKSYQSLRTDHNGKPTSPERSNSVHEGKWTSSPEALSHVR